MILADENIATTIIEALREREIQVYSVYENQRGITDKAIIELSIRPPRIILTEDKDFGEWVFAHGITSISVIFLRYHYHEQRAIARILAELIEQKGEELFGMYTTVTVDKVRYRII